MTVTCPLATDRRSGPSDAPPFPGRAACCRRQLVWTLMATVWLVGLSQAGCVRRRLTVRTTPPGAQVFIDDQEIGTTPCSAAFTYYGTRKITVMKEGYRTETLYQQIHPPWYELPPLDFVVENLVPREIRDERVVDVQLVPEEIVPPQRLLERAQSLRESARSGTITPLVDGAAPAAEPIRQPPLSLPGQGLPQGQPLLYPPPQPTGGPAPPLAPNLPR
jgi:hypothetical protein